MSPHIRRILTRSFILITYWAITTLVAHAASPVLLGIDVLEKKQFSPLRGKRVALLTHAAGVNGQGKSTIDVLWESPQVKLVALLGPEHGIYSKEEAFAHIKDGRDKKTGLPIYSLHGEYRKPAAHMLKGVDILVIDLQDLGTRSYTYVATMKYAIEACFEQNVEVIILDRPNPQGGLIVDGPPLDKDWEGFLAPIDMPYVYGLTLGELASYLKNEPGLLNISNQDRKWGKLTIIPMAGWRRSMPWSATGLHWVATSPNIPSAGAAIGYPMTGLGAEIGPFRHGIGSPYPFRLLSFPGKSPEELIAALQHCKISGLDYKRVTYKDKKGREQQGVYVLIQDWNRHRPTELSLYMMQLTCAWSDSNPFAKAPKNKMLMFNKHMGSNAWWKELSTRGAQARVEHFSKLWDKQARGFQNKTKKYWLYPI